MRKSLRIFVLASTIIGGLGIAVPLYAAENAPSSAMPKGNEMMGGGDMMGMMNMMTQMNQMMETCNKMMESSMQKHHGSGMSKHHKRRA